jgi:hypothetical protein
VKRDLVLLVTVLVAVTVIALLLGATNFATAVTFGEIAFAATLVWVLLKRP